jgi:hypothetical protein
MDLKSLHNELLGSLGPLTLAAEHKVIYDRYLKGQRYILGRDMYSATAAIVIALGHIYYKVSGRIQIIADPTWDQVSPGQKFAPSALLFRECVKNMIRHTRADEAKLKMLLGSIEKIQWSTGTVEPLNWVAFGYISSKGLKPWMRRRLHEFN